MVIHTGFWTYALIAGIVVIGIAVIAPPLFQQILDAISKLARAARGG
jgi:Na+-transporting NADH:ubiquinone oxidoreductase subunit NqrB